MSAFRRRAEQLERDLQATRQAHIDQVGDLNRHIERLTEAAVEGERKAAAEIAAIRAACVEQVQQLERRVAALTAAAVAREHKHAADIAAITAVHQEQVQQLEERVAALTSAAAAGEDKHTADIAAIRAAHQEQVQQLERRVAALTAAAAAGEDKHTADVAAIRAAHQEQVQALKAHNSALTEAATASARQLQQAKETDYQLLMIQQNLLAEFRDIEPDFLDIYERCKIFTMTSIDRLYCLYKSIEYLSASAVPGDVAECGVWRGGSCMLMALALLRQRDTGRRIVMFDTFEGHPQPDAERDVDLWGNKAVDEWQRREASGTTGEWGFASIAEARANLESTDYPADRLVFVKGMVEATVRQNAPARLALLRLDTDWYESTRMALRHLYPRLVPGGVLIIDDYGHYQGQRQAVDAYFREIGHAPLLQRIDYSCRVMVKTTPGPAGKTG